MAKKKRYQKKQYEFRMKCVVEKVVTVEADSQAEATAKANAMDWLDERDDGISDWEIVKEYPPD